MEVVAEKVERLDKYVSSLLEDVSRSTVQKMIDEEYIFVNGEHKKANYVLKVGDVIRVVDGFEKEMNVEAQNIDLNIVYEDDDLIVINKASGMVVHPGNGNYTDTLVNALMYYTSSLSEKNSFRPGIVHRLDKDTSGLMIVCKNDKAHALLAEGFKNKTIKREYIALVWGVIGEDSGVIDAPIGRDEKNRLKMCVTGVNAKRAVTHFKVLKRYSDFTLLKLVLDTGRTHQIRVHMKYIGHPVYNDPVYTNKECTAFGQFLHSATLDFVQPITKEHLHFECPLPKEFEDFINQLDK